MKVISRINNEQYNANINTYGWHIWKSGCHIYCTNEQFTKDFIILL